MYKTKLVPLLIALIISSVSMAEPGCLDLGYNDGSKTITTTGDWVNIIAGESTGTRTDGTITGIDAVAYKYGLEGWNHQYLIDWCLSYEDSITSVMPAFGVPTPVANTFTCEWVNEPSSASDVTSIIKADYCVTRAARL